MTIQTKQFNFMLWMTVVIVLTFIGAGLYAFVAKLISWQQFASAVAPIASGFAGYWLGKVQQ